MRLRISVEDTVLTQVGFAHGENCWLWKGTVGDWGYGLVKLPGERQARKAHRAVWGIYRGEIEPGQVLDHLCRNRLCVRPDHLQAVSNRDNILLGEGAAAQNARRTHCVHGHEFTPENTRIRETPTGVGRSCRACERQRAAEHPDSRRLRVVLADEARRLAGPKRRADQRLPRKHRAADTGVQLAFDLDLDASPPPGHTASPTEKTFP